MRAAAGSVPFALAALLALGLLSCGGKSAGEPGKAGPGGAAGGATAPATSGPLTEAECMQLLDHYLELALAEKRATLPPEQVPTDEQVARIRIEMRGRAKEDCVGQTERTRYECAMQARTTRALGTCLASKTDGG